MTFKMTAHCSLATKRIIDNGVMPLNAEKK